MIYTLTLNPSLDYIVAVENFQLGAVNRTREEVIFPGGKGINVSMVLKNLKVESVALGFTAGFTGAEIERLLAEREVRAEFLRVREGMSRINVKVRGARETEINGMGPEIDGAAMTMLMEKLWALKEGDFLVLAGSIPTAMPKRVYADLMEKLDGKGVHVVVDCTGEALLATLPHHPFLIKPNHHELGELFGVDLESGSIDQLSLYAGKLREMGAENVLVSLGGRGALLVCGEGKVYSMEAPAGKVVNTVGSGDSMVAGFLAGYLQGGEKRYQAALRLGVCAGSASAFSMELATGEEVERLLGECEKES